ncbi:valine--tRNA ligase [candidate division KSB1 bacterium]|nr:valine--tRNA ligase [candidate division KSB1 bacterium]
MQLPKNYQPQIREPYWEQYWEEQGLHRFDRHPTAPIFSVDTPPPYVSAAHLHVGHAMSYSQAEFIVRFQRMQGKNVFYPMGFDDNGLPTERYVESTYRIDKSKIKRSDFIELCLQETAQGRMTYEALWRRLGLSIDWSLGYSTINPLCRRMAQLSFLDLYQKGRIYRAEAPVMWCPHCQTALAQADLEDKTLTSALHEIQFTTANGATFTIATTRPELLLACVAIFVHPADPRFQHLHAEQVMAPLTRRTVPVIGDETVAREFGTGAMMVCTWGDAEDVQRWKKYQLATIQLMTADGQLTAAAGEFAGLDLSTARGAILAELRAAGKLIQSQPLEHTVQVHERCGTPVEFYQTAQWFIKILDRKAEYLRLADTLAWYPAFMKRRYQDWVENLKWDWCISRQRYYGVPFPLWYCETCGTPIFSPRQTLPIDPTLTGPEIAACPHCQGQEFQGETDVMDTWMTSSLTPQINALWQGDGHYLRPIYPLTLRVQAFEIIRTWLFYTIVKAEVHSASLPWRQVMISGWGLDQNGEKMSKRRGNFVSPDTIIARYSADALRFWAAGAQLGNNLRFSEADVAVGMKLSTKLWHACRLVYPFLPAAWLHFPTTEILDRWLLTQLQTVIDAATTAFEEFAYARARQVVEHFFWRDFCDHYLECIKARLWLPEKNTPAHLSALSTLQTVLLNVLKLFAPFLPHLTEELYQAYFRPFFDFPSIHVSHWPQKPAPDSKPAWPEDQTAIDAETIETVIGSMFQILTQVRQFKSQQTLAATSPLARVTIHASPMLKIQLEKIRLDLISATRAQILEFIEESQLAGGALGRIVGEKSEK